MERTKLTDEQKASLAVPAGVVFRLGDIVMISAPHPYCITPKHVEVAADQCGGMLTKEAIRLAEQQGAACDTCRKGHNGILSVDEHTTEKALEVVIPEDAPRNLNKVEGLHAYLLSVKQTAEGYGITGFAFPKPSQIR